jgi:hypothetical protein
MQINGIKMKRGRDDVVQINVGGTIFTTLVCTLTLHDSILKRCLEDGTHQQLSHDANGITFLDRDPVIFVYILNWMRSGQWFMSPTHPHFGQVGEMADYLGLDGLLKELRWRELKAEGIISFCVSKTVWKVVVFDSVEKCYSCHTVFVNHRRWYKEVVFLDTKQNSLLTCKIENVEELTEDFIEKKIKELSFFYASTLFSSSVNDLTLVKLLMSISLSSNPDSLVNQL